MEETHPQYKSVSLSLVLFCHGISESVYQVPPLLPFPAGRLRGSAKIQESAQSFYKAAALCLSCLLHLAGLLKYLPAAGDQTLALNIVLYMHYTEGLMVTADAVTIPIKDELKVHR